MTRSEGRDTLKAHKAKAGTPSAAPKGEAEAQRGQPAYLEAHSWWAAEPEPDPASVPLECAKATWVPHSSCADGHTSEQRLP